MTEQVRADTERAHALASLRAERAWNAYEADGTASLPLLKAYRTAVNAASSLWWEMRRCPEDVTGPAVTIGGDPSWSAVPMVGPRTADDNRGRQVVSSTRMGDLSAPSAPITRRIRSERRSDVDPYEGLGSVLASSVGVTMAVHTLADGSEVAITDPRLSDGYTVWQGSDFDSDGTEIDYSLPGSRKNRGKVRNQHPSWCVAPVRTLGGRVRTCEQVGTGDGWTCPDHGSEQVRGGWLPIGLDDGASLTYGTVPNPNFMRRYTLGDGQVRVDRDRTITTAEARRGRTITMGKRSSFTGPSKGKRGQVVTERPSEPVMASGRYTTRLRAPVPCTAVVVGEGWVRRADGTLKMRRIKEIRTGSGSLATRAPKGFGKGRKVVRASDGYWLAPSGTTRTADPRAVRVLSEQVAAHKVVTADQPKQVRTSTRKVSTAATTAALASLVEMADKVRNGR